MFEVVLRVRDKWILGRVSVC